MLSDSTTPPMVAIQPSKGYRKKTPVKLLLLLAPVLLGLAGCISSSNPPPPARNTTVVVPQGSGVTCSDSFDTPCH